MLSPTPATPPQSTGLFTNPQQTLAAQKMVASMAGQAGFSRQQARFLTQVMGYARAALLRNSDASGEAVCAQLGWTKANYRLAGLLVNWVTATQASSESAWLEVQSWASRLSAEQRPEAFRMAQIFALAWRLARAHGPRSQAPTRLPQPTVSGAEHRLVALFRGQPEALLNEVQLRALLPSAVLRRLGPGTAAQEQAA